MRDVVYGPRGEFDWRVWTNERSGIDGGGGERGIQRYLVQPGDSASRASLRLLWAISAKMRHSEELERDARQGLGETRKIVSRSDSSGKEVVANRARAG